MGSFFWYILFGFLLNLFSRCNSKESKDHQPISYVGQWSYSFPFYSSELYIKNDGTFKFHEQGCMGHGYSEGKWRNYGTKIILTSLEHYSKNEPLKLIEVKSKPELPTPKMNNKKGKIEYYLDPSILNMTVTYKVGRDDTTNVFFDRVQLRISGDTLYHLDAHGYPTDTKYVTVKTNR